MLCNFILSQMVSLCIVCVYGQDLIQFPLEGPNQEILLNKGWVGSTTFNHDSSLVAISTSTGTLIAKVPSGDFTHWIPNFGAGGFAPNGKYLVGVNQGKRLEHQFQIYDIESRTITHTISAHSAPISALAVSPDSQIILTGAYDYNAKLWDADTGEPIDTLVGAFTRILSLAFSTDGELVLTGSDSGRIRIYQTRDGKRLASFFGHIDPIVDIVPLDDGTVFSAESSGTVYHWDLETQEILNIYNSNSSNRIGGISLSPDRKTLFIYGYIDIHGNYSTIRSIDLNSNRPVELFEDQNGVLTVSLSPEGQYAITEDYKKNLILYEWPSGSILRRFEDFGRPFISADISSDEKRIALGSTDGVAQIWDLESGELLKELWVGESQDVELGIVLLKWIENDQQLVAITSSGPVVVWEVVTENVLFQDDYENEPIEDADFSDDGRFAVIIGNGLIVIDLTTMEIFQNYELLALRNKVEFVPGLHEFFVAASANGKSSIFRFSLDSNEPLSIYHDVSFKEMAVSNNFEWMVLEDHNRFIFLEAPTGTFIRSRGFHLLDPMISDLSTMTFAPNDESLILFDQLGKIHYVDYENYQLTRTIEHNRRIWGVGFLSDERMYSLDISGDIRIWPKSLNVVERWQWFE